MLQFELVDSKAQIRDRLGLDRNFTIYDQADRIKVVKSALEASGIDTSVAMRTAASSCG